jgi:Tol biopolymer transport system component
MLFGLRIPLLNWSQDTFVEYEQSISAAVAKLRLALGDSADNPRFVETVAKHGYRFVASVCRITDSISIPQASAKPNQKLQGIHSRWRQIAHSWVLRTCLSALLIAGTGAIWWMWHSAKNDPSPAVPLTGLPGYEIFPSFSPEGTRVAFSWYEPGKRDPGIYVKLIGPGDPIRLTASRDGDFGPAWSPDGLTIAFLRARGADEAAVVVIPALGGPEKEIAVIRGEGREVLRSLINSPGAQAPFLAWSRDGRWLLAPECEHLGSCAIVRLSVDGSEKRRVTFPPNGHSDGTLAVSPDGRTLAFTRTAAMLSREIYKLAVSGDMAPAGNPKQLTFDSREIEGLSWTPDGKRLVFSSTRAGRLELWQMTVAPPGKPIRITAAGEEPTYVAVSREGHHLIYSHYYRDSNIWRMAISGQHTGQTVSFNASTRIESEPKYSPDGKRIAFESSRTGNEEIWISKEDGSNPVQVTWFRAWSGSPRWSPDGGRIAFDSNVAGDWNIYVADSQGGKPARLTISAKDEMRPSWSHDGKWIYYSSTRAGRSQIFKMPSNGGTETQITKNGGFAAFESADGKDLYYATVGGGLAAISLQGGSETILLKSIYWLNFAPGRHGVYFIEGSSDTARLNFLDCRTLSARSIAAIPAPLGLGGEMAVSPDEAWVLYEKIDRIGSELMLIENFR